MGERETRRLEQFANSSWSELVAVLRVDRLSGSEFQGERGAGGVSGDVNLLGDARDEVHLDARFGRVP